MFLDHVGGRYPIRPKYTKSEMWRDGMAAVPVTRDIRHCGLFCPIVA